MFSLNQSNRLNIKTLAKIDETSLLIVLKLSCRLNWFTMATLEAIKYADGKLHILDQLQLPQKSVMEEIKTVEDGWHAIKDMKVSFSSLLSISPKLDTVFA